jgi:hypothetical protein
VQLDQQIDEWHELADTVTERAIATKALPEQGFPSNRGDRI